MMSSAKCISADRVLKLDYQPIPISGIKYEQIKLMTINSINKNKIEMTFVIIY